MEGTNNNSDTYIIKSWMTELWAWADKFDIPKDYLPRNPEGLLALKQLNISCKEIIEIPESLDNLVNLSRLDIHRELTNVLPTGIVEKYRNKQLWLLGLTTATLYKPSVDNYSLSLSGFFFIEDDWDEKKLVDLKYKTGVEFLFGLQTTERSIEKLDIVDNIIICQTEAAPQVIMTFETMLEISGLVGVSIDDIKSLVHSVKPAQFIQTTVKGKVDENLAKEAIEYILTQIPESLNIDSLILSTQSNTILSESIWKTIMNSLKDRVIDENIMWGFKNTEQFDYLWLGVIVFS
ncbi:hypothetical protein [uncultured Psychrobacter sp.]|uniref:hypothetical protein n=1 Tax=uncultured Psychrobacter sp. TaxID=259303 RepID=UPI00345AA424